VRFAFLSLVIKLIFSEQLCSIPGRGRFVNFISNSPLAKTCQTTFVWRDGTKKDILFKVGEGGIFPHGGGGLFTKSCSTQVGSRAVIYCDDKLVFVLGRSFQPNIIFVGKARSLPKSGAPERCVTWAGSGLTVERRTKLELPV
jgi:hypothetical protein